MPMVITIASKQPVTMSAAAQTRRLALVPPPDGAAAASPPPRATVTRAHGPPGPLRQVAMGQLLATSRVNGNWMMKMGCTSATGPVASAMAWHTEATTTMPMPASQTLRLIR